MNKRKECIMKELDIEKLVALADMRFRSKRTYRNHLKTLAAKEVQQKIQRKKCVLKARSKTQVKNHKSCLESS